MINDEMSGLHPHIGGAPGIGEFRSKKDPRWNCSIEVICGLCCNLFDIPELVKKYEELKKRYGDPPNDLEWAFWKD